MAHQAVSTQWDAELVPTVHGRTDAPTPDCPVEVALEAIGGRWTTLLLRNLMMGDAYSYSELSATLPGLSDKVLTDRLADLVSAGMVERTSSRSFPPRTTYAITDRGRELRPLLIELYRTGLALQNHGRGMPPDGDG